MPKRFYLESEAEAYSFLYGGLVVGPFAGSPTRFWLVVDMPS